MNCHVIFSNSLLHYLISVLQSGARTYLKKKKKYIAQTLAGNYEAITRGHLGLL